MTSFSRYLPFVAAMALVVVASNILVQFPMQGQVGGLSLADILTWGAFTYPFSFLVKAKGDELSQRARLLKKQIAKKLAEQATAA